MIDQIKNIFSRTGLLVAGGILVLLVVVCAGSLWENVAANEIVVIQSPVSGTLKWCTTPGLWWQGFGSPTHYPVSFTFWFSKKPDQGSKVNQSLHTRFYDGGTCWISGSVQIDMPLDTNKLNLLHKTFHSPFGVEQSLIRTVFEKSIFMSGPLMNSKESYAEKRPLLIFYIEDQALHGVYQTTTQDARVKDPLTGVEKTVTLTKIVSEKDSPGGMGRQETSPLAGFGIRAYNMNINDIIYDDTVSEQIAQQQKATMAVQTAMVRAKEAEQDAITVVERGKADAAKAKWAQEVLKATAVTKALQEKEVQVTNATRDFEVAEWQRRAANETKQKEILLGEGESTRRQLLMKADNQLEVKIKAWKEVMISFADQIGKHSWVPQIQMGEVTGKGGGSAAMDLVNLLTVKTAKDLGVDLNMTGNKQ